MTRQGLWQVKPGQVWALLSAGLIAACFLVAGCTLPNLVIEDPWIRLPAIAGRPAVAYFTVTGKMDGHVRVEGKMRTGAMLTGVRGPFARAELHESMAHGGMSIMRPLKQVFIGYDETVAFAPGGKHVMLFGIDPKVRSGDKVQLHFWTRTGDGEGQTPVAWHSRVEVVGPGDPSPYQKRGPFGLW